MGIIVCLKLYILFLALREATECGPTANSPVACQATKFPKQTFFSAANSGLPEGTYIAASLAGALQLADYLDAYPNASVRNLLISDATVHDLATDFGYGETEFHYIDLLPNGSLAEGQVDYVPTLRNLETVSARIMDKVAPTLESLSYLAYIRIWDNYGPYWHRNPQTTALSSSSTANFRWGFRNLPERVTHLHIVSGGFPPLSIVRKAVPSGTHIRFSGNLPQEFSATSMFIVQWTRSLMDRIVGSANSPIIVTQPNFSPSLNRGVRCGNPGIKHNCMLARLGRNRDLHLSLPTTEDYHRYGVTYEELRLFPLSRAITEFEDRIGGGEGEWAIPEKDETYSKLSSWAGCR
ncbi:hypothetical protein B0H10DRAFT_2011488 [Mycena sp. CBHHK59/15]|nr:hypothetical protein B0H10DRAFT_2011488 [Mycena sp. CBHHK59/15]